jgi:hypothetical protein
LIQSGDGDWIKSLFPSGLRSKSFDDQITYQEPCLKGQRAFYLAVSLRQIKKLLLCVLGDSAVKILFRTSMKHYTFHIGEWQTAPWWSFAKMLSTRILYFAIKNNKPQLRFIKICQNTPTALLGG